MNEQHTLTGRFKKMHRGYFRLAIAIYIIVIIAGIPCFLKLANTDNEVLGVLVFGGVWIVGFWPAFRTAIWIYDGFVEEKEKPKQPSN